VITPRRTRLVRVPDLRAFRSAIAALRAGGAPETSHEEPLIVVPTRSAAGHLPGARAVTRDELYEHLHARLSDPPRRLSALERDVIAQAAAHTASGQVEVTFRLRPGLVAEMTRFYDHLRRQSQRVNRFEDLIDETLGSDDLDRGAQRMRRQTRFLAAAFREFERLVRESGGCDEHGLRERLLAEPAADPVRHLIVTVADWIADAEGLFVADFDLLARLPGLAALDIVATEALLGSGFHERLHDWLPGIEEATLDSRASTVDGARSTVVSRPVLITPPGASADEPWWTLRDREEELVSLARHLKADRRNGDAAPLARTAVVFKHPLPYLYLAGEVFGAAGIPYQGSSGLPLAAEPTAAAVDVTLEAVAADFTRDALVSMLRSPHFVFVHEDIEVSRESTSALDRALSRARYLGQLDRLEALARERPSDLATPALRVALGAARELAPLTTPDRASTQLGRVIGFLKAHARPIGDLDPFASRERRARAAIADMLAALAAVHASHGDPHWTIDDVALAIRRWIEEQTFEPESAGRGVHLLDDRAVRYADFDDIAIVGVVEADWPERPRRNIFYPPSLLKSLGWPSEKDRRAADDARFLDLLVNARRRTRVSVFTLDDDALATRSMQLDEIPRARLSSVASADGADARVFVDEALSLLPVTLAPLAGDERAWAELRLSRSSADAPKFHGTVAGGAMKVWSVSALETYLGCPFRFFAQHVLRIEEEPDDEEMMDPRRQGRLVHAVFEQFFRRWQDAGRRAITPDTLDQARAMFTAVVDNALKDLPAAEAGLERTRLLGSPAAAGLGEAVMRMEAERPIPVVERLLEHSLEGEFGFLAPDGSRTIALRGKADRLDLLEDGTFRLIDYKLGWPPDRTRALQLPIYALCAEQRLSPYKGRHWTLGEAVYLAFKGPRRVVPLFARDGARADVLAKAQALLISTVDAIADGRFPPTPDDVFRCETCSFASVCRKDYVGDV
jgi:RecB family exonuclease